jgi:hypothetical protein
MPLCMYAQDPTKCSNNAEAFAAYTSVSQQPGAYVYVGDCLWNAGKHYQLHNHTVLAGSLL